MRTAALALALGLAGCAENAILEIELTLPSLTLACGAGRAAIEARIPPEGSCFFDQEWLDGDSAVIALEPSERAHVISVLARGADVTRPLCLRVRGCPTETCPPPEVTIGPRAEIEIERPFFVGRYTRVALGAIELCADSTRVVPPCEVTCADAPASCDPASPHPCE